MTQLVSYCPGVYWTEAHLVMPDLDVRGAVLVGDHTAVVWDTLSHPNDLAPVAELVGGKTLIAVYSHADWDHCWGTSALNFDDVIAQANSRQRFGGEVPRMLAEMRADAPGQWEAIHLVTPTRTFEREMTLDLGGITLEMHALPGHTRDSIVGFLPRCGVLLGGDAVEDPFPVLNSDSPLDAWITQLEHWAEDPWVKTVVPGHGAVGGIELISRNLAYLHSLRRKGNIPSPSRDPFYQAAHQENLRYARASGHD
jgi:glyoxylase-like metal-dependent hydrolase (beta-lactamase superfamily II)